VRVAGAVEEGAQRQRGRDREPVADVAQPRTADRGVDGEHEGVVAGRCGALHEVLGGGAVSPQVELEPLAGLRCGRRDVLDGGGAHRGERVRDVELLRHGRDGGLAGVVHHPREAGGG
jgi:hypothetical protein